MISRLVLITATTSSLGLWTTVHGQDAVRVLPKPVAAENFAALAESSPFNRTLNLSDSLILTGIAKMGNHTVATIMNRETKETFIVSEKPNPQGWKMTTFTENSDLEKVTATVTLAGEETVKIRYNETSLKPGESRPGSGTTESTTVEQGRGGKGERSGRGGKGGKGNFSPEIAAKLEKLSDAQRSKLRDLMRSNREKMGDLSSEDRAKLFQKSLEQISK